MQALYEWQLNAQPWQDLHNQYLASEEGVRADPEYFRELVEKVTQQHAELDTAMSAFADRTLEGLDPIEHAILLIAMYEMKTRVDVPYRVVINEAVELARKFGATDGHKFVNAVMDRAAFEIRSVERDAEDRR